MKKSFRYQTNTSFLDLLFNSLLGFTALFFLAYISMNIDKSKSKTNTESKAEFIITLTWDKNNTDDIDVYLEDPLGKRCYFAAREIGLSNLDRDDLGVSNDRINMPDGSKIEYRENREVISIRGYIPGEYICNVHYYRRNEKDRKEVPVTVQLDKINPKVKTIVIKQNKLTDPGDEKTMFRFKVDKDGNVSEVTDLFKQMTFSPGNTPAPLENPEDFIPPNQEGE